MSIRHSSQLKTAGPDQEKTLLPEWRTMTVFKSIQKRRKENDPRNAYQGPSTTKPGDGHAVFTLPVTPTTTPVPPFLLTQTLSSMEIARMYHHKAEGLMSTR